MFAETPVIIWHKAGWVAVNYIIVYVMKLSIFKILNHIEVYKIGNVIVFFWFKSSITILLSHITISTCTHVVTCKKFGENKFMKPSEHTSDGQHNKNLLCMLTFWYF